MHISRYKQGYAHSALLLTSSGQMDVTKLLRVIIHIIQTQNTMSLRKFFKQFYYQIFNTFILLLKMVLFVTSICPLQGTVGSI